MLVLTLARSTSPDAPTAEEVERWSDPAQSWPALGERLARLLKRLNRLACKAHGACAWAELYYDGRGRLRQRSVCRGLCSRHESRWVSVVEQHRPKPPSFAAWPHVNVVVTWPWLADQIRSWRRGTVPHKKTGKPTEDGRVPTGDVLEAIVGAGFGYQSWALVADSTKALAGYFVKIAGETVGEVSKLTQRPVSAPAGFRRLRSGRGFLPKPYSSRVSGTLVTSIRDADGGVVGYQCVGRPTKGVRVVVAHAPPEWTGHGSIRWIDLKNKVVYQPTWVGWAALEDDADAFSYDVGPREPPREPAPSPPRAPPFAPRVVSLAPRAGPSGA